MVLVALACAIALPVGYYFMSQWLEHFEYRTEISWWIFASTLCGALLITLLTVSLHAAKVALINPAKTLRNE